MPFLVRRNTITVPSQRVFSCSITHLRLAAPSPGRRTTSLLTASLPDQPSGSGRVALSRLKIGCDLGEQVVQRPGGASGEPLDGVGDLGRVAVGPRAARSQVGHSGGSGRVISRPDPARR